MRKVLIVGDDATNIPSVKDAIVVATNDLWSTYKRWNYLVCSRPYYTKNNIQDKNFGKSKKVIGPDDYAGSNRTGQYQGNDVLITALYWSLIHLGPATIGIWGFENKDYSSDASNRLIFNTRQKATQEYSMIYNLSNNKTILLDLMDLETFTILKV